MSEPFDETIGKLPPLGSLRVVADSALTGSKHGWHSGRTIIVSPAMLELIRGADTEDELRCLLGSIRVKRLPFDIEKLTARHFYMDVEKALFGEAFVWDHAAPR